MSFPDPSSPEEMKMLLQTILSTMDNNERKAAESAVVRSLRNAQTVGFCVDIIQDLENSDAGVRQLGAVLLRKKIFSLWRHIELEHQSQLKQILITQLAAEPVKIVRNAIARVVAALARAELRDGDGWPELHTAICQAAESEDPAHRELSMVLTFAICEVVGDNPQFIEGVGQSVWDCLVDPVSEVRLAALKAVQGLLPFLGHRSDNQTVMLNGVIPRVLQVLEEHLVNDDSVTLMLRTLDLVEQIVEPLHSKTQGDFIVQIVEYLGHIMGERRAHLRIREHAAEVAGTIVESKKKLIAKRGLAVPLIDTCVQLMGEDESLMFVREYNESDDELDDDELELQDVRTPCMFGGLLLSTISEHIPNKLVMSHVMSIVQRTSANPRATPLEKKGIMIALAASCEGGAGTLRRQVPAILNLTQTYMNDESPVVQEAAAFSLQYFVDNLQPEILTHHRMLIPMLVAQLRSEHDNVRGRVAETLDSLCENLAEDLEEYIPQILPPLIDCIAVSSIQTQTFVCGALASIAQTRCPALVDSAEQLLELLQEPMKLTTPESIKLRARATEAIGIIAVGCGKDRFAPFFNFFHEAVMEGFNSNRPELREQCFGYYANMCEMLQREFAELLPQVMPPLLDSIQQDAAIYQDKHPLANDVTLGDDMDEESETDDDDEGDDAEIHMRVRTADVEEKCSAVFAIGIFAVTLRDLFQPYVEPCEELLTTYVSHFHTVVRQNTIKTLAELVVSRVEPGVLQVRIGVPEEDLLAPPVREAIDDYMRTTLLPIFAGDVDQQVISACCEGLDVLMTAFGAQAVHEYVDNIVNIIITLLQNKHVCQEVEDAGGDDEGGLPDNHCEALNKVTDTLEKLAGCYGADFSDYFSQIGPELFPYLAEDRPGEDYALATGTLANVLIALGPRAGNFFDTCFEIAIRLIDQSDESSARSNCCLLLRALAENAGQKFTDESLHAALAALWAVAACEDEIPAAVDNAISAACSFMRCLPHMTPLDTLIVPVLRNIPMRIDREENENCIRTLCYLMADHPQLCGANMKGLVECCAKVLASPTVAAGLKEPLGASMGEFFGARRAEYADAFQQLPQRLRGVLAKHGFDASQ